MTIYRTMHDKDNPYFMLDRTACNDDGLSYKAIGILTYLLSKPDLWETRLSDLVNRHTDGRESVRSGLKELEDAGYIVRNQEREVTGKFSGKPIDIYEKPKSENPTSVNRPLVSNDVLVSKETTTTTLAEFGEVCTVYESNIGLLTPMIGDQIKDALKDYPSSWIIEGIQEAVNSEARSFRYVLGCLKNWKRDGKSTSEKAQQEVKEKENMEYKITGGDM